IFALAPPFSTRLIPARAKTILALALALALTPLAERGQHIPQDVTALAPILLKEIVVGLAFALALGALAAAVQAGASVIDTMIGFSFSNLVDPMSGTNTSVFGELYSLFATMVFLLVGGDRVLVLGLAKSYDLLPLAAMPSLHALAVLATDNLAQITLVGIEVAALVVTDAAFALVARAVPQMNVMFVGLPAKVMAGLAVSMASLPFVAQFYGANIETNLIRALQAL